MRIPARSSAARYDHQRRQGRAQAIRLAVPGVVLLAFLAVKAGSPPTYETLVREDGLLENLQFGLYAIAGLLAILCAERLAKVRTRLLAVGFLGLGLCFLFVGLEEISWGERLFGYEGPSWIVDRNTQSETSLHNLSSVQGRLHQLYILVGALGFLVPLFARRALRTRFGNVIEIFVPARSLVFFFLPVALIYALFEYGQGLFTVAAGEIPFRGQHFIVWRDQEPAELLLAAGFALFVVDALAALERRRPATDRPKRTRPSHVEPAEAPSARRARRRRDAAGGPS